MEFVTWEVGMKQVCGGGLNRTHWIRHGYLNVECVPVRGERAGPSKNHSVS